MNEIILLSVFTAVYLAIVVYIIFGKDTPFRIAFLYGLSTTVRWLVLAVSKLFNR